MTDTEFMTAIFIASVIAIASDRLLTFAWTKVKTAIQRRKDEREAALIREAGLRDELDKRHAYQRGFVDFFQKSSALNPFSRKYEHLKYSAYENGRSAAMKEASAIADRVLKRAAESKPEGP